jgi:hypothetical protein
MNSAYSERSRQGDGSRIFQPISSRNEHFKLQWMTSCRRVRVTIQQRLGNNLKQYTSDKETRNSFQKK